MDNLFSSPEKPAERPNGSKNARSAKKQDATLLSSDMDIPDSMSCLYLGGAMRSVMEHGVDHLFM